MFRGLRAAIVVGFQPPAPKYDAQFLSAVSVAFVPSAPVTLAKMQD
ncbi:hypothetical protein VRK_33950 [Vibrio sp. MEBiC08052]|nr:hypothetical protein VRK_33950 [Vibrio sp. MEBiC08052]